MSAGCALGALGAVTVGMLVRSRLYGVSPMDPVAFGAAALVLLVTTIAACLAPASRASRLNVVDTLRME